MRTALTHAATWLAAHPIAIPLLLIAIPAAATYGWRELTRRAHARGRALTPLSTLLRSTLRFALREDTRPLITKPKTLATHTTRITGRHAYATLTAATLALGALNHPYATWTLLALPTLIAARYTPTHRTRRATIAQMFAVAHGECRYPKGAELAPWSYVAVQKWENLTTPGATVVTIPAAYQSEDLKTREKFERQFNGTVSEDNAWTYTWESAKNRVVCTPAAHLPTMAPYPGPGEKWSFFPLGIAAGDEVSGWDITTYPHALVCGPTGTGKSVLQRNILFHALAHSDTWRIIGIDPKRVELSWLRPYPSVLKIATELEESVEVLRSVKAEMHRRYEEMEEAGVNHASALPNPPPAILVMIDETTILLAPEGVKSDEGKERDALHAEASLILGELGRLSRASMIHIVAALQRPDAQVLRGEFKANMDCRIAAGRMDTTPSLMVLDSEAANRLPKIRGRGMIRLGGDLQTFQGYFAEQDWYDKWLAQQAAASVEAHPGADEDPAVEDVRDAGAPGSGEYTEEPRKRGGLIRKIAAAADARAASLDDHQEDGPVADDGPPASDPSPAPPTAVGGADPSGREGQSAPPTLPTRRPSGLPLSSRPPGQADAEAS